MRLAAAMMGVVALGWASGAMAQTAAAPAKAAAQEPTAMLLQTMCLPWLAGAVPAKFASEGEARGYKALWKGPRLTGFTTPKALFSEGWQQVALGEGNQSCSVVILWVGDDPLKYLTADVQNWLIAKAGGTWLTYPPFWKDGEFGKATRMRGWRSGARSVTLTETPDAAWSKEQGVPVVMITVTMEGAPAR